MLTDLDVILSLTRTSRVGYLRDVRRLTVALSRARLGLYVLGRREVFENCTELKPAFDILLKRSDKLQLVAGELWPSSRILKDEEGSDVPGQTEMSGVEHLGQWVFDMTNTKVQELRQQRGLPEGAPIMAIEAGNEVVGEVNEEDGYVDEEPLDIIEEDVEEEMKEGSEAEGGDDE